MIKNPPPNAGDTGSIPGIGRSHLPRDNKGGELHLGAHMPQNPYSATTEATAVRSPRTTAREEPLLAATREKARTATKAQHSQKLNK